MTEPTIKTITAQVPADLADALDRYAKANERSFSAEVRIALRQYAATLPKAA
jgi:hypothetical protein